MPKILVAECRQEVSTFNPVLSRYEDYSVASGDGVLKKHAGVRSSMTGALSVFAEHKAGPVIPTYSATAGSAGTLVQEDFERIADEFLAAVQKAPAADAVFISLHGAMGAEREDDPEGYLLAATRKILGERIPIVVSLDLHGVVTERMLQHSDAVVLYHTYPHVDLFETGERAARLLLRIVAGEVKPVTALVDIPALVRGDELITETGLLGRFIRVAQEIEESPGGLSAGMFIGNPFTDVAALRSGSIVVTDDDPERARREALKLAEDFWAVRERLQAPLTDLKEAVRIAADTRGPVLLMDAADAPSSGASGDSNVILRALMEQDYRGNALVSIVDAPAVKAAVAVGVGSTIHTTLGGTRDPDRYQPIPVEARVHMISEGRFFNEHGGTSPNPGRTAVLKVASYTVVVTSRPISIHDRSLFLAHGQDPARFGAVVAKCPHWHRRYYTGWVERLVNVDAPGSTSANLRSLGHTKCARPIFPLDAEVPFSPQAKVFQRP